jgi:hypothetical protein
MRGTALEPALYRLGEERISGCRCRITPPLVEPSHDLSDLEIANRAEVVKLVLPDRLLEVRKCRIPRYADDERQKQKYDERSLALKLAE